MSKDMDTQAYREALLLHRRRLIGDSSQLKRDTAADNGDISRAPSHLADQGSDAAEQELMLERLSSSSATLQEIDDALDRIDSGSFGTCEECGEQINERRLKAMPHAALCIACQRKEEEV